MRKLIYALVAATFVGAPAMAQEAEPAHEEEHFDAIHHTADGNYLDFSPFGKIELPRLFVVRGSEGMRVDAFASSGAAIESGRYHAVAHETEEHAETPADAEHGPDVGAVAPDAVAEHSPEAEHAESLAGAADENVTEADHAADSHAASPEGAGETHEVDYLAATLEPTDGEMLVDLSPTRHVAFLLLSMLLLVLLLVPMGGRYKKGVGRTSAPRGLLQNMLETLVMYIRDEVAKPNLGPNYGKYLPYLLTAFFFILTANLLGLVPFGATATSNIAVTAVLAVFTFVITQLSGTKEGRGRHHGAGYRARFQRSPESCPFPD